MLALVSNCIILKYGTVSSLTTGPNGRGSIKQVPLCDLKAIFFHKLNDLDDSLAHKHCFILLLMLRH